MLGLLIGLGFFIFKMDEYVKEFSFYKKLQHPEPVVTVVEKKEEPTANSQKPIVSSFKQIKAPIKNISTDTSKTKEIAAIKDSLKTDSLKTVFTDNEDVVVKKDELLNTKAYPVTELDAKADASKIKQDSLLETVSGVKNENGYSSFTIEYWRSPLNYKGYRMAKNKIIVYGITPETEIKLFRLEKNIYLRMASSTYKLEYSNEFRQLEKITDEGVLAALK